MPRKKRLRRVPKREIKRLWQLSVDSDRWERLRQTARAHGRLEKFSVVETDFMGKSRLLKRDSSGAYTKKEFNTMRNLRKKYLDFLKHGKIKPLYYKLGFSKPSLRAGSVYVMKKEKAVTV